MKKQSEQRKITLSDYGFGTDVMKSLVVCKKCNSIDTKNNVYCKFCNEKLPSATLYELYRSQHKSCERCGTVLSQSMVYCPKCGTVITKKRA